LNTWGEQPLSAMPEEQATVQALRLLTSAAEFDSATGGVNREAGLYPVIKLITADGVRMMPDPQLRSLFESSVSRSA
jgi:proteasome beta subunit